MANEAVQRVLQLVDFLAEYDAQRNPPVYDVSAHGLLLKRDTDMPAVDGVQVTGGDIAWLTVDFVELPPRPIPPEDVADLFSPAVGVLDPPVFVDDLEEDERAEAEAWVADVWEPWEAAYRDALVAKSLYRELFEAGQRLTTERESLELIWGFGRLRWESDGVRVDHPIITVPVEVDLDGSTQQLAVRPGGPPDIDVGCLAGLTVADKPTILAARQANAFTTADGGTTAAVDPWSDDDLRATLRRFVRAVDHNGVLAVDAGASADAAAVVDTSWVLYMRRRRPDYQGFLDHLRELYAAGVAPPDPLAAVVIDAPSTLIDPGVEADGAGGAEPAGPAGSGAVDPLLLPLATNEEQQRIVHLARSRAGVTVQGPPGTGKSHTIANVIAHYVAQGKRVLVTAEKEQALKVLGDKVPEGIRNLTVSVLGADEEGRRRLETAISEIQTRVTGLDTPAADRRIEQLRRELDEIDRDIAEAADLIFRQRAAEVKRLPGRWVAGPDPTPSEAAIWVAEHADAFGYIPDDIDPDTAAPLSAADLAEFATLIRDVTPRTADDAAHDLPTLDQLPSGAQLADRVRRVEHLRARLADAAPELTHWGAVDAADPSDVEALAADIAEARDWRAKVAGSWLADIIAAADDPLLAEEWSDIAAGTRSDREAAMVLRRALATAEVTVPAAPEPNFAELLRQAHSELSERGKVRLFAREAKRAVAACQVNARVPTTPDDVQACILQVELNELRRRIRARWTNRVEAAGGPDLGESAAVETAVGGSPRQHRPCARLAEPDLAGASNTAHSHRRNRCSRRRPRQPQPPRRRPRARHAAFRGTGMRSRAGSDARLPSRRRRWPRPVPPVATPR